MARFRVVSNEDWPIIEKYLTKDDFEGTVVLVPQNVADQVNLSNLNNQVISNPFEDGEHDISVYVCGEINCPAIEAIRTDNETEE